ncbi:MAG: DUF2330 domain-containing protein [Cyanobacteria bacterium P01_C01_bin.118]
MATILCCGLMASPVQAFCGFFVATADGSLENTASHVVIAHSGNRSIFMMANDFQGDVKDFSRIVPIPVVPDRKQVSIGDGALIEKLSAFTAPRLAQYFDRPCRQEHKWYRILGLLAIPFAAFFLIAWLRPEFNKLAILIVLLVMAILVVVALPSFLNQANKAGSNATVLPSAPVVTIEDQFSVGEYDIAILSANESNDLVTWLQQNQYQVGKDAAEMLQSYIDAGMKFFVVRVNLEEFKKRKGQFLRPIVLDYESDEFMLPIRLGTLNASGDQDLIIHVLSPEAYVETANYETLAMPTDAESIARWPSGEELPAFIQEDFGEFYNSVFQQIHGDYQDAVFLEYATRSFGGNIKCDPCTVAADGMPTMDDFKAMGAWWGDESPETLITRLHVRYNSVTFPQDLQFREIFPEQLEEKAGIVDRSFPEWAGVDFQARYVIRRPMGAAICASRWRYRREMSRAAQNLAMLTGWDIKEIRQKMTTERRLNALDAEGQTALQRAVMAGDVAQAKSLIEQGANVNLVGNQRGGMTPLVGAIANSQPELIQLLLDNGANVNVSWRGEPLLLWTIGYGDLTTVKQLLEAGVNSSTLELVWETVQLSGNNELIEVLKPYVEDRT